MNSYLFYFGHPAHYHMFKHVIDCLKKENNTVTILIKKKDILEDLLREDNIDFINLLPEGRTNSLWGTGIGLLKRDIRLFRFLHKNNHDVLIGTEPSLAHVGKVLNIPSLIFNEDDYDVVPLFSKTTYPFCTNIISPEVCKTGRWDKKKIEYPGYQKLAYLHPDVFCPSIFSIDTKDYDFQSPYFLIRLSGLNAHHDGGIKGFDIEMLKNIVKKLEHSGNIYISSERKLPDFFNSYSLNIALKDIHHILAHTKLFLSDSQSMTVEASLLGTPSLRLNDFAGRISVLSELEHKYALTYGFKSSAKKQFIRKMDELLKLEDVKGIWKKRRSRMLREKINVNAFFSWLLSNYPQSITKLKDQPDFIDSFK